MAPNKHYVVYKGRKIGIFGNWWDCHNATNGFQGNAFQSFQMKEAVEKAWMSFKIAQQETSSSKPTESTRKQSSSDEPKFDPLPPLQPPAKWLIRK